MQVVQWTAPDGTRLSGRHWPGPAGGEGRRPVLMLAGLTRNSRDFLALAEHLSQSRAVFAMDWRGRGLSGWADPVTYRPDVEAGDVVAGLDSMGWQQPAIVGTSRGGIVAMLLALTAADRVGPVVLNDIGPVIDTQGLAAIVRRMSAMIGRPPESWEAARAALVRGMGAQFPALGEADWDAQLSAMYRDAGGRPVLDYDPRLLDVFASFDPAVGIAPFWPAFDALAGRPVLTIRGALSDLLSQETLDDMARRLPGLATHLVAGEGHAPLLRDAPTIACITAFLDKAG